METIIRLDEYFQAFSDPVRRQVVELLGKGARRAGELATLTEVAPATMSKHLRVLLRAGVVDDERSVVDARVRLFFLRREALAGAAAWLGNVLAEAR